jgi:PAS domain S-box-containing protein
LLQRERSPAGAAVLRGDAIDPSPRFQCRPAKAFGFYISVPEVYYTEEGSQAIPRSCMVTHPGLRRGILMAAKGKQRPTKKVNQRYLADVLLKSLDYTKDGIIIGNMEGTILYHNKAWLDIHAFTESESIKGMSLRDFERPELLPIVDEGIAAMRDKGAYERVIGTVRRDGVYHDVLILAFIVPSTDPPVVMAVLREVTDLVQTKRNLERVNRELGILNEVHGIISSATNRAAVTRKIMTVLGSYLKADYMSIYKVDYSAGCAMLLDAIGVPRKIRGLVSKIPLEIPMYRQMAKSPKTFVVEQDVPGYHGGPTLDFRKELRIKRSVGFVFRTEGKNDYMAIFGLKRDENVTPEVRMFLESVANRFGIAIEKVELLDTLKARERELQRLTAQLITSSETERRECARMLHDEVGQAVTALRLEIEMFERNLGMASPCMKKSLEAIKSQVRYITGATRNLSQTLHPAMLEDLGLAETLNWYIDNVIGNKTLVIELEVAGFDENLPLPVSIVLYRVAQECLTNIVKHAHATKGKITLTKGYPHAIMVIEDNGRGISLAKAK